MSWSTPIPYQRDTFDAHLLMVMRSLGWGTFHFIQPECSQNVGRMASRSQYLSKTPEHTKDCNSCDALHLDTLIYFTCARVKDEFACFFLNRSRGATFIFKRVQAQAQE